MQSLYFKTHSECVDYLREHAFKPEFIENHSRKDLAYCLRFIEKYQLDKSPYAFRSMCTGRMIEHIRFYLRTHESHPARAPCNYYLFDISPITKNYFGLSAVIKESED